MPPTTVVPIEFRLAAPEQDIFDGLVVEVDGGHRFVDAAQVGACEPVQCLAAFSDELGRAQHVLAQRRKELRESGQQPRKRSSSRAS